MSIHQDQWAIIEQSGMEGGDRVVQTFADYREATRWRDDRYDPDEIVDMHVDLARWDAEQACWSYDH